MSNWSIYKREWEDALDAASVTDRNARKLILAFMRKINTLQNMYDRMSWSRLQGSPQFESASDMAWEITDDYLDQYNAMLHKAGYVTDSREVNIGDWFA